jgi:hypothetical protein
VSKFDFGYDYDSDVCFSLWSDYQVKYRGKGDDARLTKNIKEFLVEYMVLLAELKSNDGKAPEKTDKQVLSLIRSRVKLWVVGTNAALEAAGKKTLTQGFAKIVSRGGVKKDYSDLVKRLK